MLFNLVFNVGFTEVVLTVTGGVVVVAVVVVVERIVTFKNVNEECP